MTRPVGLSVAVAAIPFAFAAIRAVNTGHDFRYFLVGLGGLVGAGLTLAAGRARLAKSKAVFPVALAVLVAATVAATLAAMAIGTTFGPGILVVAGAFGFCFAVSTVFLTQSRV